MKSVPFSDILASVCQLIGLDRNTLNDKSFAAIRDMLNRRFGVIWDREEWPESERRLNTFVGNPVTLVQVVGSTPSVSTQLKLTLDADFPRVYLVNFANDAYKKGTIGETFLSIENPFYITTGDGSKVSVATKSYNFTYESSTDANGEYITTVTIDAAYGTPSYSTYAGVNGPLTAKVTFGSNQNFLVQLDSGSLQGLEAYDKDPRNSSKALFQEFIAEDFSDRNDIATGGSVWNEEYTYLRFLTAGQKFIKYRQTPHRFFGAKYSSSLAYGIGSQAFFDPYQGTSDYNPTINGNPVRGDFWNAINSVPLAQPPANVSQFWKIASIPYRFKDYLINGISADFLRSEGRAEEANIFDQLAENAVQQQIDVLVRQQGQVQRMNMVYSY